MVQYDPDVIQNFAEKLYKKANSIIASYTIVGLLLGAVGGYFLDELIGGGMTTTTVVAVIVSLIGFAAGQEKAFMLKLQQTKPLLMP